MIHQEGFARELRWLGTRHEVILVKGKTQIWKKQYVREEEVGRKDSKEKEQLVKENKGIVWIR